MTFIKNKKEKNLRSFQFNFFPKNCKGADKVISIYWFVILALAAGGVFAMVYVFYGTPYDVREAEVNIFTNKIADCISRNGVITNELVSDGIFVDDFDFLNRCDFNFETEEEDWKDVPQYFFEIYIYEISDLENPLFVKTEGNINWRQDCLLGEEEREDYEKLPECLEKRFYTLSENGIQYLIKILSAVGKSEKNVA